MKREEYHERLRQWEAEGYDVSEFKQKWFSEGGGTDRSRGWMPKVAGILDFVGGGLPLPFTIMALTWEGVYSADDYVRVGSLIILSIIAIVGGGFAIKRRNWRLSLAGAICVLATTGVYGFGGLLFGIPAITFTILGRSRFK